MFGVPLETSHMVVCLESGAMEAGLLLGLLRKHQGP